MRNDASEKPDDAMVCATAAITAAATAAATATAAAARNTYKRVRTCLHYELKFSHRAHTSV